MKTAVGDPIVIFQYHPNRSKNAAAELLDDYKGIIVADGYSAYTSLLKTASFKLAGCMAHVRRKFFEAEKYAKASKIKEELIQSTQFLRNISLLYKVERKLKEQNADYDTILQTRIAESVPILQTMELKLKELEHSVLPKSPLGKAINYSLNQWSKLTLFTTNGQIPIDNNAAENAIRPFVVGRKNWLFADTPKGAHASANIYSLIESAKACGIEPSKYLKYLLENISAAKNVEDIDALMPHKCRDALIQNKKA
jgi:transposase